MRVLEILTADGPSDPRPLLLAAALCGKFQALRLPPELEWARLGFAHCLPPVREGVYRETWAIRADELHSPAQLAALADDGPWLAISPATARTAYEWYHDTCFYPQLADGPVVMRGQEPPADPVCLTRPAASGRALWVAASDFGGGHATLWAVGRTDYGAEVWEGLGRCPARLEAGAYAEPAPSAHNAFLLSEAALRAVRAAHRKDWGVVGRHVNKAWGIERAAGAVPGADLAVVTALEGGEGNRGARPTAAGLAVVGATV